MTDAAAPLCARVSFAESYCASCEARGACEVERVIKHVNNKPGFWQNGRPADGKTLKDCRHEAYRVWAQFHGRGADDPVQPLPACADLGIKAHFYAANAVYRGYTSIRPPGAADCRV